MTSYDERQQKRRERFERRAERKRKESEQRFDKANDAIKYIPPGQPILVGHHSEAKHRRALKRHDDNMRKGIELGKDADRLENAADSVGNGGIASDDPNAIEKLQEKLADLESLHEMMKRVNKAHIEYLKNPASLDTCNLPPEMVHLVRTYMPRYSFEPHPYPAYVLKNSIANIRRINERIEKLSAIEVADAFSASGAWGSIEEDRDAGRIVFTPSARLEKDSYLRVRAFGFLWSRSRQAFVRKITPNAIIKTKQLFDELNAGKLRFEGQTEGKK